MALTARAIGRWALGSVWYALSREDWSREAINLWYSSCRFSRPRVSVVASDVTVVVRRGPPRTCALCDAAGSVALPEGALCAGALGRPLGGCPWEWVALGAVALAEALAIGTLGVSFGLAVGALGALCIGMWPIGVGSFGTCVGTGPFGAGALGATLLRGADLAFGAGEVGYGFTRAGLRLVLAG